MSLLSQKKRIKNKPYYDKYSNKDNKDTVL